METLLLGLMLYAGTVLTLLNWRSVQELYSLMPCAGAALTDVLAGAALTDALCMSCTHCLLSWHSVQELHSLSSLTDALCRSYTHWCPVQELHSLSARLPHFTVDSRVMKGFQDSDHRSKIVLEISISSYKHFFLPQILHTYVYHTSFFYLKRTGSVVLASLVDSS